MDSATVMDRPELQGTASKIEVHPELKKHHKQTGHLSHFEGSDEVLVKRVQQALAIGAPQKSGRFPGSLIIEIDPQGVFCCVGEEARTRTHGFVKPEAQRAEVVLHTVELVAKRGKLKYRGHQISVQADWLVVAVHGYRLPSVRVLGSA